MKPAGLLVHLVECDNCRHLTIEIKQLCLLRAYASVFNQRNRQNIFFPRKTQRNDLFKYVCKYNRDTLVCII